MGERVDWNRYFMNIAAEVATRSTCPRKHVGAVIVRDRRILSTGYNGSLRGLPHCDEAGCLMEDGHCIATVHAEANALLTAGRFGASTDGTILYTTDQPCFSCSKELIQAGVVKVYYARTWAPDDRVLDDYRTLQSRLDAEHFPTEYEIVPLDGDA